MKKALQAGLISAFVAPGAGHFFLKHKRTGICFFAAALVSLSLLFTDVMQVAQGVALDIQTGVIGYDLPMIMSEIHQRTADSVLHSANTSLYWFIACWAIALIDSVRLGLSQDKADIRQAKREQRAKSLADHESHKPS